MVTFMLKFSTEQFDRARSFIFSKARGLERAMFSYDFEGGALNDVVSELQNFQNSDGGFGHGLEPDFRLPDSSCLASSIGLQIMSRLSFSGDNPMLQRVIHFLKYSYDRRNHLWEPVPEAVVNFPRAPWWEYKDASELKGNWGNPTAELLGYLYEFGTLSVSAVRDELTSVALEYLKNRSETLEMHELPCFLRLAERVPQQLQPPIYQQLDSHVEQNVAMNSEQWKSYSLQPIQVADSPRAHYFRKLRIAIEFNLDFLIEQQDENGSWVPTWKWGRFEKEWEKAKQEWSGILTLNNLRVLRSFGRIQ